MRLKMYFDSDEFGMVNNAYESFNEIAPDAFNKTNDGVSYSIITKDDGGTDVYVNIEKQAIMKSFSLLFATSEAIALIVRGFRKLKALIKGGIANADKK